jgi:hypothetical protein
VFCSFFSLNKRFVELVLRAMHVLFMETVAFGWERIDLGRDVV